MAYHLGLGHSMANKREMKCNLRALTQALSSPVERNKHGLRDAVRAAVVRWAQVKKTLTGGRKSSRRMPNRKLAKLSSRVI